MQSRQGDLVKVLTLIDDSLNDLHGSSKQQQQMINATNSATLNPTTAYLNTLTRDLLEEQKRNSALVEENQLLQRRLNMQDQQHRAAPFRSNSTTNTTNTTNTIHTTNTNTNTNFHQLLSASTNFRATTLAESVNAINRKVDQQAALLRSKQVDGMCSLAHTDVQASLDRCLAQLQRFREGELIAKQQREELFTSAERDRDRLAAAMLEIQHLQGERRGMEERLEAFELENMRLTNDLQRERERTSGAQSIATEHRGELAQSEGKIEILLRENETLKNQNHRLVNEVDEMMNLERK
jgi:hypothetical protein